MVGLTLHHFRRLLGKCFWHEGGVLPIVTCIPKENQALLAPLLLPQDMSTHVRMRLVVGVQHNLHGRYQLGVLSRPVLCGLVPPCPVRSCPVLL